MDKLFFMDHLTVERATFKQDKLYQWAEPSIFAAQQVKQINIPPATHSFPNLDWTGSQHWLSVICIILASEWASLPRRYKSDNSLQFPFRFSQMPGLLKGIFNIIFLAMIGIFYQFFYQFKDHIHTPLPPPHLCMILGTPESKFFSVNQTVILF